MRRDDQDRTKTRGLRTATRGRRAPIGVALLSAAVIVAPASAASTTLEHTTSFWISDPGGVDGQVGIEPGDPVYGARGTVRVDDRHARIRLRLNGLTPGHTYTMWIVYFNDRTACAGETCHAPDFVAAGGGVLFGAGAIADDRGFAVVDGRIDDGDGADVVGPAPAPPPPFSVAPYEASADNEFHLVIRSHGPRLPGQVTDQLSSYGGGCHVDVGPLPGQHADEPVAVAPGECGDVQVHVFG